MYIYHFEWSSGYYSCVLLHEKKFSEDELEQIYDEISCFPDGYSKWLIEKKGFKEAEYASVSLDCGGVVFHGGDNNGRTL